MTEEYIKIEGLWESEQKDINTVNLIEQDMNTFLFDTPPNADPTPLPGTTG